MTNSQIKCYIQLDSLDSHAFLAKLSPQNIITELPDFDIFFTHL